ncbi:MAG: hypothetical protein IJA23_01810, partial [Clostridia bacterium]|nr:hypothetical protein [Clostridia bacterium]
MTITSFTSNIPNFVIYDMQGNQVDSTAAFEIAWSVHNQFGNAVRFRAEVQNMGTAMFVLAFEDSTPPGYVPFAEVNNGFEFSVSFNDANSNLKTYSTETNNFYYQPQGMGYQFFTRIDLTREEVRSIIKEGEPGTGWIDLTALTIDISSFVPDATFVGYINGWTNNTYQELKAAALINYGCIGEVIVIEALYNFDDNEVRIEVYLIPKDSISQTYQDSGNSGSGGSGSEEGGEISEMVIIDIGYTNAEGQPDDLMLISGEMGTFSGDFAMDTVNSTDEMVIFNTELDASLLNGATTFALLGIMYEDYFTYFPNFDV